MTQGTRTDVRNLALASAATMAVLVSAQPASAQSFTIQNGQTVTTTQNMAGNGDVGLVQPGGTIATTGNFANAIEASGPNATITNSGTITTAGFDAWAIFSTGTNAVIANRGTIATTGLDGYAIFSAGTNAMITNSGTIATAAADAYAIFSTGTNAVITNSGTIATAGANAYGIRSTGANATIANSGTIRASGTGALGIWSAGPNGAIVNAGAVLATGAGSYAIVIGSANTSLTLLRGSVLQGSLYVDAANAATTRLNIATGYSTALRFDVTFAGGVPATITAGGMPLAVNAASGLVVTADVSALRGQGQMLGDLTGGIFSAVDGRRDAGAAVAPIAYASETNTASAARSAFAADYRRDEMRYERTTWLKGFGASRDEKGSGATLDQDQKLAGAVSGIDLYASANGRAGVFFGGAWGRTDVPQSQEVTATSAFGGGYATAFFGNATLDLAVALGWTRYDSSRRVADNTVAGGIANADADYDGVFIAPRIAFTQPFLIGAQTFEAKLSGYYAGLFLDSFTETGTFGGLSVDKRDLHLFVGRAALAMPLTQAWAYGVTRVIPSIGVEGRVQTGDNLVNGTLLGTGIVFDAGAGDVLGGFASLRLEHDMSQRLALFVEAESLWEDTGSNRLLASGGLKLRF